MRKNAHAPTYRSWQMMKNRCTNPHAADFNRYGGRGISFPAEWGTYEGFVADMGVRPVDTTLDRLDSNKDYSVVNCRWASRLTQSRNRDYTLSLTFAGQTRKVWEWAAILDLEPRTVHHRLWRWKTGHIEYSCVFIPNPRSTA